MSLLTDYEWTHILDAAAPGLITVVDFNIGFYRCTPCRGGVANVLGGPYEYDTEKEVISFGMGRSTKMLAPQQFQKYESFASKLFFPGENIPIKLTPSDDAETATLEFRDIKFNGAKKLEARYGKPERVFLDIKYPENGYNAENKGYTVREVKYDDSYVKTTEGEWFVLDEPIQGKFKPEPNHTYRLRLHRYTDPKTQKHMYYHDMTVICSVYNPEEQK